MTTEKKPIPTISAEAEILAHALSKLQPGELITYEELNRVVGFDVTKRRGPLATARRKASRESGVVTMTVVGKGLRRAQGMDYCDIVTSAKEGAARKLRRGLRDSLRMPKEEHEALTDEQKVALNIKRSVIGAMAELAKPAAAKRLNKAVTETGNRLPAPKAFLEMLQEDE